MQMNEVNGLLTFYMLLDFRIYSFERRPRLSAAPDWAPPPIERHTNYFPAITLSMRRIYVFWCPGGISNNEKDSNIDIL
jgi:hypothetical protein